MSARPLARRRVVECGGCGGGEEEEVLKHSDW